jgi:hypothetical protein
VRKRRNALHFASHIPNVRNWLYGTVPGAAVSFPHLGTTNNHSIGSYPRAPTQQQCESAPPMASFPVVAQPLSRSASGETTAVAVNQFMRDRDRSFDPQLPQPHTHRASIDSQQHPSTLQSVEASSLVESPTRASSTPKVVHQPSTLTTPNEPVLGPSEGR